MNTNLRRKALIVAAALFPSLAAAYPIPPSPLWRQVQDAEVIVVATVVSIEEPPPAPPGAEEAETRDPFHAPLPSARLHVLETWKGEIDADVAVPFQPGIMCPAPPHYQLGETVLAFLARDEDDTWVTVHRSYGTIYASPADLRIYADRVKEALALQAQRQPDRRERTEWLIRCTEHPATRWHGLYELAGSRKPRAYGDDDARVAPAELLTDEQRARIARAFIDEPALDTVPVLLDVIGNYKDPILDKAVYAEIEHELAIEDVDEYDVRDAMVAMLTRAGDKKAEERLPEVQWDDATYVERLRKAWTEVRTAQR